MSSTSTQNLQPDSENADSTDNAEEDVSIPTLSSDLIKFKAKNSKLIYSLDRYSLLVVPKHLQAPRVPLIRKTYRTRRSGYLKGFMDLPMDVVFEVSLRSLQNVPVDAPNASNTFPDRHVSPSKGSPATFPALEAI